MTRRSMHLFPDNEEIMELISIVKKMISMIQSKGMPITMNTLYSLTKEEGKERNVSSVEVKLDTLGPVCFSFLRVVMKKKDKYQPRALHLRRPAQHRRPIVPKPFQREFQFQRYKNYDV